MKPHFTPTEAKALFGADLGQTIQHEGFEIIMDGPFMSPSWAWAPQATDTDEVTWFVTGEPGDPIEGKDWVGYDNSGVPFP